MKIILFSSKKYENKDSNYGDCILIDTGDKAVIYDCGCDEHAQRVIDYLNENNFEKVYVILSHNDADHFNGIKYLIDRDRVYSITTILLLKHIDDILDEINDKRRTRESIRNAIKEYFDNISSLTGNNLIDSMDDSFSLDPCINFVGPSYDYILEAVSKALDNSESDSIDMETIVNAISVQVEVIINNHKLLLTGDASFNALEDKIREYDAIQLPHHGKKNQADKIFEANEGREEVIYLVSDNTGSTNGGSDELMKDSIGRKIKNTKLSDIEIDEDSFVRKCKGCYGYEIYSFK